MESSAKTQLIAFIPLGIPGSGKSTFFSSVEDTLNQKGLKFVVKSVSSDAIRGEAIKAYLAKNANASKDKAFQATGKESTNKFNSELEKIVGSEIEEGT